MTSPITNTYVRDRGRTYRVCRHRDRVILVALRPKDHTERLLGQTKFPLTVARMGRERFLDVKGRRARQIVRKQEAESRD
jgi:hypothetical protein